MPTGEKLGDRALVEGVTFVAMDQYYPYGGDNGRQEYQVGIESELVSDKKLLKLISKLKLKYKLGLLSNAGQEEISIIYKDNINKLFDVITVSYQEGISKPSKEMFDVCVDKLGLTFQETLFIDDSKTNIDATKKLGLQTYHYQEFKNIPDLLFRLI